MLQSLLDVEDLFTQGNLQKRMEMEKTLDEALDCGDLIDDISIALGDHTYQSEGRLQVPALKMFAGYVARKAKKISTAKSCDACFKSLSAPAHQPYREDEDFIIHAKSKGYLITPSDELLQLVRVLELSVLETVKVMSLSENIIFKGKENKA